MYAYCLDNPVNYVDYSGNAPVCVPMPPSDYLSLAGLLGAAAIAGPGILLGGAILAAGCIYVNDAVDSYNDYKASQSVSEPDDAEKGVSESSKGGGDNNDNNFQPPMLPDVKYPGNDPTKAPEGTEWRGPGEKGSKEGSYYNPETKESWRPDLDHPLPIGPHWDYKDANKVWWRVYENGEIKLK